MKVPLQSRGRQAAFLKTLSVEDASKLGENDILIWLGPNPENESPKQEVLI